MAGDALLDTNIVIGFLSDIEGTQARLSAKYQRVVVTATVLGELIYGAMNSTRIDENLARIEELMTELAVLMLDGATAYDYGRVKQSLRAKGRMIPDNDLWIAAAAIQNRLTLVTKDRHFESVDNMDLDMW
jgi:tRNA(fMet)-specific endonuclease VapC